MIRLALLVLVVALRAGVGLVRARDREGREQRKRSRTARARRPDLAKHYGRRLPDITPGEFAFSLDIPSFYRNGDPLPLDTFVESFSWEEVAAEMSGSVELRRPTADDVEAIPIARGTLVRCRVRWQGRWYELWTMRCDRPEVDVGSGEMTVSLADDMAIVRRGSRRYVFRKTRRRKHGWFGHDALRVAARKDGVELGAIAKCTRRMGKIDVRGSFLSLAVHIYKHERDETHRKFILRMRNGKFEAVPYRRNRLIYVLADQIRSASVAATPNVREPVTVITGKARVGQGRRARRIQHTEFRRDVVRKLGYAHKTKDYGRVDSAAELRRKVKRDLAANLRVNKDISIEFAGIPFIRRGDGAQIWLPWEGFEDDESFVYVRSIRHAVSAGSYTTTADFTVKDPFLADKRRIEREKREAKNRVRGGDPLTGWRTSGASVFDDAIGYRNNEQITGRMCFAELGMGTYMGDLPYRTVIEVRYNGTIIRSIKLDIGDGGDPVKGVRREVDLHIDTASALPGFPTDGVDLVQWRVVES